MDLHPASPDRCGSSRTVVPTSLDPNSERPSGSAGAGDEARTRDPYLGKVGTAKSARSNSERAQKGFAATSFRTFPAPSRGMVGGTNGAQETWDERQATVADGDARRAQWRERRARQKAPLGAGRTDPVRYVRDPGRRSTRRWTRRRTPTSPPGTAARSPMRRVAAQGAPAFRGASADAVRRLAERWPLGLARSSRRRLIDTVLDLSELRGLFSATIATEEPARGKLAPDVYLAACQVCWPTNRPPRALVIPPTPPTVDG